MSSSSIDPIPTVPADLGEAGAFVASARLHGGGAGFAGAPSVTCIPARDEAGWIERSLRSALDGATAADGLVLVVNGSRDATTALALGMLETVRTPWRLVDLSWRDGEGTAPRARRIAMDLAVRLAPEARLLSLDADTEAAPGWREAHLGEAARGFDLVCGAILFDPGEASRLPEADPAAEALVREARAAVREITALQDPDPDNPWPHHGNIGGANFSVSGAAYRAVGGLPLPPFGEDRALLRRIRAAGLRVRFSEAPRVFTSCRLDGRASGGLSDDLRKARRESDPEVDEMLEPASVLALRIRTRRALRDARDARTRAEALRPLGLDGAVLASLLAEPSPAALIERAEAESPVLARRRWRLSELAAEMPPLLSLLAEARSAAGQRSQ